jgi:DNA-binding transcriptional ArsR family regulator
MALVCVPMLSFPVWVADQAGLSGRGSEPVAGRMVSGTDNFWSLDKYYCRLHGCGMFDVTAIEDPAAAEAALDPTRARLLAELATPASATMLAARVGLPRQQVNYHLRALERHGLVELVTERRKGNVTERVLRATANSYVISPAALAALQPDPGRAPDQLSARWLLALAARLVRDVGALITSAAKARKRVATFALDTEVRFASAADRAAFAEELTGVVTALVSKYHDETAEGGRRHRVVVAVHPAVHPVAAAGTNAATDETEDKEP